MNGFHKHKCQFCAFVWQHHDANDVRHSDGGAHECPSCHRCNWSLGIYTGEEDPKVTNGVTPAGAGAGALVFRIHPDQNHRHGDADASVRAAVLTPTEAVAAALDDLAVVANDLFDLKMYDASRRITMALDTIRAGGPVYQAGAKP